MASTIKKRDDHCWMCHQLQRTNTLFCSSCVRCFHSQCLNFQEQPDNPATWKCPECVDDEKDEKSGIERKLIEKLINKCSEEDWCSLFVDNMAESKYPGYSEQIVNPVCLKDIEQKIVQGKYRSYREVLTDIKWIHHNCCVFFKGKNNGNITNSEYLLELFSAEIASIKACVECFLNANGYAPKESWFTMVCEQPHLIIWAKLHTYPNWPAKVMSIDGDEIHVRFFGEHESAVVSAKKCFLYSRKNPHAIQMSDSMKKDYGSAVQEANTYINNLVAKYGDFAYADQRVPFDVTMFNNYMNDLKYPTFRFPSTSNKPMRKSAKIAKCRQSLMLENRKRDASPKKPVKRTSVPFEENNEFAKKRFRSKSTTVTSTSPRIPSPTASPLLFSSFSSSPNRNAIENIFNNYGELTTGFENKVRNEWKRVEEGHAAELREQRIKYERIIAEKVDEINSLRSIHGDMIAEIKAKNWCKNCKQFISSAGYCGIKCHLDFMD